MNKWKLAGILFCLCGLGPLCAQQTHEYRTVFSAALERHLAQYPQVYATPGVGRFEWMKSYAPSNTVRQSPRVREQLFGKKKRIQEQVEAVAVFLFNMYISAAAYREDMPAQLTLDYVGALDGFFKCEEMIPVDKVQDFYTRHREEIQTRLTELFAQEGIVEYQVSPLMNEMRERRFLQVLASAPTHEKWPGYVWTGTTRLTAFAYREDTRQLRSLVHRSLAESSRKVIVFEVPHMEFEDLDNPLALPRNKAERLYRCVNDECAYCTVIG
ncbi:MAG: hypothetical protein MJ053_00010 [Elusimicrobiaceae bacterium]|nr:hypothetical protein [Elusimicrobiaceae bacterium]